MRLSLYLPSSGTKLVIFGPVRTPASISGLRFATQRGSAVRYEVPVMQMAAFAADLKALTADKREREVSDVIASAVAAGKYAPGDEPKLRALAGKLGTDALREFVATVPDGAAGPRRALASGATMPVDPPKEDEKLKNSAQAEIDAALGKVA